MLMRRFFLCCLFCCPLALFAQDKLTDAIAIKMALYPLVKPSSTLFLHTDKTVYTSNEMIWFTAYLLKNKQLSLHKVLSVALLSGASRAVTTEKQFIMQDGISFGDMRLPDSLPAGKYTLIAYTNLMRNGQPDQFFVQPVTVKTVVEPPFTASLKLVDSTGADGYYAILLEGFTKGRDLLANAKLSWKTDPGKVALAGKTDIHGEYVFKIPVKDITPKNSLFETTIAVDKESRKLKLQLPVKNIPPAIKFYPEGGYAVNGQQGYLAWEALAANGSPLRLSGVVYKNGRPLDTVETNSYGIGRFVYTPVKDTVFTLMALGATFPLPAALAAGAVITIRKAVAEDTLNISLRDQSPEKLRFIIHDFQGIYLTADIKEAPQATNVKLSLAEVPRGLMTLTVLDEQARPLAERLFFAHYTGNESLSLAVKKTQVQQREKVEATLTLKDKEGKPANGIVSIACVQDNRLELKNRTDIESYFYLQNPLGPLPADPTAGGFRNREYLENILLVKGWRKYTWPEMLSLTPADTASTFSAISFNGKVTEDQKPLKKPVLIGILPNFGTVTTDAYGAFTIPNENVELQPDKKALIAVSAKNPEGYAIAITNPYVSVNKALATSMADSLLNDREDAARTESMLLSRNERAIQLAEIKLSAKNDRSIHSTSFFGANACGDYICSYNILNCPNHYGDFNNRIPVKGGQYHLSTGGMIVYSGCTNEPPKHMIQLPGIYANKEFYGSNYAEYNPPDPEYFSTIYWKHGILLSKEGTAAFSFYASDITGKFTIVAQGISTNDVIFTQKSFTVTKKEP